MEIIRPAEFYKKKTDAEYLADAVVPLQMRFTRSEENVSWPGKSANCLSPIAYHACVKSVCSESSRDYTATGLVGGQKGAFRSVGLRHPNANPQGQALSKDHDSGRQGENPQQLNAEKGLPKPGKVEQTPPLPAIQQAGFAENAQVKLSGDPVMAGADEKALLQKSVDIQESATLKNEGNPEIPMAAGQQLNSDRATENPLKGSSIDGHTGRMDAKSLSQANNIQTPAAASHQAIIETGKREGYQLKYQFKFRQGEYVTVERAGAAANRFKIIASSSELRHQLMAANPHTPDSDWIIQGGDDKRKPLYPDPEHRQQRHEPRQQEDDE
ncbi:hypothetical protein [Biostraticola tofi]|uniref:Uncharacterized protein n=1 Tax=Biostraticola tofi TaxID=466109 RepID=A0A4R3YUI9_9GAMM|nr:hypothetical protein [Biostraticola tofi]TCV96667.1 hypothetical protein EDC52_104107 [Biostraticola tofi]